MIGLQCDRTGPTQIVGTVLCPGYQDYINLVNSKGGVEGYKIKVIEIDNEYKVPPAIEAYERFKKEGAVLEGLYGTPQTAALNKKLEEDKILGTSPGFGTAAAADGKRYPYLFPIAASYWSQAAAAVAFAKEKLGGSLKGKKIAYLFYDNPAGKEPLPILEDLAKTEGFELRTFAVPPPGRRDGRADARHHRPLQARLRHHAPVRPRAVGVDQGAEGQGLSAEQGDRLRLGRPPRPTSRRPAAMAWPKATTPSSSPASARTSRCIKDIEAMYKAQGKAAAEGDETRPSSTTAASWSRRCMSRRSATPSRPRAAPSPTAEDVKKGLEPIKDFTLGGLVPPMADHARPTTKAAAGCRSGPSRAASSSRTSDWFQAYRDVIKKHLAADQLARQVA